MFFALPPCALLSPPIKKIKLTRLPSIRCWTSQAAAAASGVVKVTKPKPRGVPVTRSRMTAWGCVGIKIHEVMVGGGGELPRKRDHAFFSLPLSLSFFCPPRTSPRAGESGKDQTWPSKKNRRGACVPCRGPHVPAEIAARRAAGVEKNALPSARARARVGPAERTDTGSANAAEGALSFCLKYPHSRPAHRPPLHSATHSHQTTHHVLELPKFGEMGAQGVCEGREM